MRLRIVVALLSIAAMTALAQWPAKPTPGIPRLPNGTPNWSAPAPRAPDGHLDLSGLWIATGRESTNPNAADAGNATNWPLFLNIGSAIEDGLPYQPWARALINDRQKNGGRDAPPTHCLPLAPVLAYTYPEHPRKILQLPGQLVILNERDFTFRQIFLDGRELPKDPNPSWYGYSTGHWEGNALIVETVGLRDGLWLDARGSPITEAARLRETFRRPNFGSLEIEITVDDPKAYTRPWTVTVRESLNVDTELLEYVCLENEKDAVHLVGR